MRVKCSYTNGAPAQAEVLVRSPSNPDRYFAILKTDPSGLAHFEPDGPGQWSVTVDDGLGHRVTRQVNVDLDGSVGVLAGRGPVLGRYLALALACIGLLAWWLWMRRGASA